jgi:hypothetical protein
MHLPERGHPYYPRWMGPILVGLALASVASVVNAWWLNWGGWMWLIAGLVFGYLVGVSEWRTRRRS